jgi:Protein of unknown function (DUF4242)
LPTQILDEPLPGLVEDMSWPKENHMPLYMDMHTIDGGVAVNDVAQAHLADLQAQDRYGVRFLRYWVDEGAGKVFCLVDAPDPGAAERVHREAHGLVADAIFAVVEGA